MQVQVLSRTLATSLPVPHSYGNIVASRVVLESRGLNVARTFYYFIIFVCLADDFGYRVDIDESI